MDGLCLVVIKSDKQSNDPMNIEFIVFGPDKAIMQFTAIAEASNMSAKNARLTPLSMAPTNSVEALVIALKDHGPHLACLAAMAHVIIVFLKGHLDRRVTITKNEEGRIISIDAKGYSVQQLTQILEGCRDIIVFSPSEKNEQVKQNAKKPR